LKRDDHRCYEDVKRNPRKFSAKSYDPVSSGRGEDNNTNIGKDGDLERVGKRPRKVSHLPRSSVIFDCKTGGPRSGIDHQILKCLERIHHEEKQWKDKQNTASHGEYGGQRSGAPTILVHS
jgi:hypothetical protein